MLKAETIAPAIYKRILKANNPIEAIDEIEDVEVAKEVLKLLTNNLHMTYHEAAMSNFNLQQNESYWKYVLNSAYSKEKYAITISADTEATIEKELTEQEYKLIQLISLELSDAGDGWKGSLSIEKLE